MVKKSFISVVDQYFDRFPSRKIHIDSKPSVRVKIIVVIPAYNEEEIIPTLNSLFFSQVNFSFDVEVVVVVNDSLVEDQHVKDRNLLTYKELLAFSSSVDLKNVSLIPVYVNDLDPKHAGVGWARKIGMDLALERFKEVDVNGIIVGLDADTLVEPNYFTVINNFFEQSKYQAASLHYEHPINGSEFNEFHYQQIALYELHLRYYKNALAYVGLPYAFHTVGSAFALTAKAYARQGGMNRRKAGEDFYFINKLIKGEEFGEIAGTKVIPSPRISDRVPFGTGRAILEAFDKKKDLSLTYDFKVFEVLKQWVDGIEKQDFEYSCFPDFIRAFISEKAWLEEHARLLSNSNSHDTYLKSFYAKFDAFWILKFIHFCRDNHYANSNLLNNANMLLSELRFPEKKDLKDLLDFFRYIDKKKGPKSLLNNNYN